MRYDKTKYLGLLKEHGRLISLNSGISGKGMDFIFEDGFEITISMNDGEENWVIYQMMSAKCE